MRKSVLLDKNKPNKMYINALTVYDYGQKSLNFMKMLGLLNLIDTFNTILKTVLTNYFVESTKNIFQIK